MIKKKAQGSNSVPGLVTRLKWAVRYQVWTGSSDHRHLKQVCIFTAVMPESHVPDCSFSLFRSGGLCTKSLNPLHQQAPTEPAAARVTYITQKSTLSKPTLCHYFSPLLQTLLLPGLLPTATEYFQISWHQALPRVRHACRLEPASAGRREGFPSGQASSSSYHEG